MTVVAGVETMAAGEFALRLSMLRGTAAYAAYLVDTREIEAVLVEVEEELREVAPHGAIARISPRDGMQLVDELAASSTETIIVDTRSFSVDDWAVLDRRRSALAHRGVVVFVTTPTSFSDLMRNAPNLASWLGGEVFTHPPSNEAAAAALRERRLATLRAWASKTDAEVVADAHAGVLPRDPEYAEWLVLLGHSELLGPGAP